MAELKECVHEFTYEQFAQCMSNEKFKKIILEEVQPYIEKYERQKSELDKKHDKIFKNILSDKKEAARLINRKFNLNIKLEDIELYDKEFRQRGGKVLEADIIYKIKNSKTFFLIEHQTRNDYHMPFRILNYDIEIMRTCEAKLKDEKEASVLAIVIHTGSDEWKAKRTIREVQEDIFDKTTEIPFDIQTLGSYVLEDVKNYTKEELLESESLLDKAMYLEKTTTGAGDFVESLDNVYRRISIEDYDIMDEIIRIGLSGNMTPKDIEKIIKKSHKGGERTMLALKEKIDADFKRQREEGKREGIRIGREQEGEIALNLGIKKRKRRTEEKSGKEEEKRKFTEKLLNRGSSIEEIIELTELSEEEITKIKKGMDKNHKEEKEQC